MQNYTFLKRIGYLILLVTLLGGCWRYVSREAHQAFLAREDPISVSVYPVRVVTGPDADYDVDLAEQLVEYFQMEGLAVAELYPQPARIPVEWSHNQAKMAENAAKEFAVYVASADLKTDYALLVDLLCNPNETKVGGIQVYIADQSGRLASGRLSNSHWDEWKEIQPHDRQGGLEVAKRLIQMSWAEGRE